MNSSSAERTGEVRVLGPAVLRPGDSGTDRVRRARLDRQLGGSQSGSVSNGSAGAGDPAEVAGTLPGDLERVYADPLLQDIIRRVADAARAQARAMGYAQGWADGRKAAAVAAAAEADKARVAAASAADAFAVKARSALAALDAANRTHRDALRLDLADVGQALADAAVDLAASALGRELASVDAEVLESVRTAMRALGTTDVTVVQVHPADLATLSSLPAGALPDSVRLVADPGVPRGGALAMSANRQVLAHLPAALERAREAMHG